jgi:hypothetical protein
MNVHHGLRAIFLDTHVLLLFCCVGVINNEHFVHALRYYRKNTMMRLSPLVAALMVLSSVESGSAFVSPSPFSTRPTDADIHNKMLSATTSTDSVKTVSRRHVLIASTTAAVMTTLPFPAKARLEGVNRPDLLPTEKGLNVIQTENFLTKGQAKRMNDLLTNLERDTGYRVRVLCQAYPNTPGLAIRDYWDLGKVKSSSSS